jgi:Na+:H+ antiporter
MHTRCSTTADRYITGCVLNILNLFTPPHLTKELLFSVFLPGLSSEAAFHIEFREFRRNRLAIASLAVPGVAAAVALTPLILTPVVNTLHLEQDFRWQYARTRPVGAALRARWAR